MGGALPLSLAGLAGFGWLLLAISGLHVALRLGGVPMLGMSAAVAAGAFLTASWTPALPLLLAAACAVSLCGLAGWLVGMLASLRTGGDPAIATWTLGWLALTSTAAGLFVASEADLAIPVRFVVSVGGFAVLLGTTGEAITSLALAALSLAAVWRIASGPLGARLTLLRTHPEFAASLGLPVARLRAGTLAVGCGLGALAGAGYLSLQGVSGPADVSPTLSVELLAAVLIGGRRWWGIVAGGVALEVLVNVTDPAIACALLIVAAGLTRRRPPASTVHDPFVSGTSERVTNERITKPGGARGGGDGGGGGLGVRDLSATLGGRTILSGFAVDVAPGEIHALIGPNGAGKTTALRAIAGAIPSSGSIERDGRPSAPGQRSRVRDGIVRTLQSTTRPAGLTAIHQVTAAVPTMRAAGFRHLIAARSVRAEADRRTRLAVEALDLVGFRGTSSVDDRLLQLACAYASGAAVIAMDEPAAGVERARIAAAITAIAGTGRAVLLVEHDLRLVRNVADRASLLLDGRIIASGPVPAIFEEQSVRAAYLGLARADGGETPG